MNSAVCCCLRLQLSMFVSTFFFRFSQTDHTDLEMIKIKCTFGKRWHHLHIVKRTMRYWYVNIILSCEIRHHPVYRWYYAVYKQNKLVTPTTAAKSWGCDAHLCILKNLFGSKPVTEENIDHWHWQLFKESTESLSSSNCCHAFISLIYRMVLHGCSLNAQINTDSHF